MICYVRGCHQPATVGAIHKLFGRVASCAGHYPDRVGYARPISGEARPEAPRLDHFAIADAPASRGPVPVITVPDIDQPF